MATLLLIVIFLSFIGLGIPDSLFGAAWPAIYPDLYLPVSLASVITMLMLVCTVVSSLGSSRVINRFGVGLVALFSTALTAAGLLGFAFAGSFWWLCLLSVPLGLGAGAIDTGLNHFVALHYNATHMSFLHCFYGVGVSVSPFLMSLALADNNNWRGGYRMAFFIQLGITATVLLALPLWGRIQKRAAEEEEVTPRNFGADVSGSVMGTQFAASYAGVLSTSPLFGLLTDRVGAGVFPWFLAALFAALLFCMVRIIRVLKQWGRYQ